MTSSDEHAVTHTYNTDKDKRSVDKIYKLHFYYVDGKYAYVNVDSKIIQALHLIDGDFVTEELTKDDSIILRKVSK